MKPNLKACVRYFDALKAGMPALPLVLSVDNGEKNYSVALATGESDPALTVLEAERVGL